MAGNSKVFSLILFIGFTIEIFSGLIVIYLNPKGKINRQFFIISIALVLWSLGLIMSNLSPTVAVSLGWRRFSALGWTVVYALLLHMILILTKKDHLLSKKQYFIFYLPAFINLYVFSLSAKMSEVQYNLIQSKYGWFNQAVNNGWDWFFYVYYISYLVIGVGLLIHWKKTSDNYKAKKQANLMLGAIISVSILGTLTDVVLNSILENPIPQMAPLFNLIPVLTVLYSIKHNSYMRKVMVDEDNLILTSTNKEKFYFYTGGFYLVGGIISSLPYFLPNLIHNKESIGASIYGSGFLYLIGLSILVFQFINNARVKDCLIILAILISIPITAFRFIEYAAITVWVFPLILMNISLVFDSFMPLIMITLVSIITQIIAFNYAPLEVIYVDQFNYTLRIGIFIFAFGIAFIINRVYVRRLKDNIHQKNIQKLISDTSFNFVNINGSNINDIVDHTLERVGDFFQVDRTYVFIVNEKDQTMTYSHEWCNEGINPEVGTIENVPLEVFAWWMGELRDNKLIYFEDIKEMPEEAQEEKQQLERQGVQSIVVVPIIAHHTIIGFIGFDSVKDHKKWSTSHIDVLNIISNILSDGFMKVHAEKEIEYMAFYDDLTGLPNRILFKDRLNQAIQIAERNDKLVATIFLDLDNFKTVNDTVGHSGGDELLIRISRDLEGIIRKTDTVSRFGGDEFLICISMLEDEEDIREIVEKMMNIFTSPFIVSEKEFIVTASVGICIYPVDGRDVETLIMNADIAMYQAKDTGKNKYIFFKKI